MADSLLSPAHRAWHEAAARYVSSLRRGPITVAAGSELFIESLAALGVEFAAAPAAELIVLVISTDDNTTELANTLAQAVTGDAEILLLGAPHALAIWVVKAAEAGAYRVPLPIDPQVSGALLRPAEVPPAELVRRYEPLLAELGALQAEVSSLRHQQLTGRDFAIGAEAAVSRLRVDLAEAKARLAELETMLARVYASRTWRIGNRIVRPAYKMKQAVNR